MRGSRILALALTVAALSPAPVAAAAAAQRPLRAAVPGPVVDAPDGRSEMELVRFDEAFVATVRDLAPEETVQVEDWPVAPGQRAPVVLRRFDVYAPDARIVVVDGDREIEVPRSPTHYYLGARIDGSGRFAIGLDPELGTIRATYSHDQEVYALLPDEDGSGQHLFARRSAFEADGAPGRTWTCGQENVPLEENGPLPPPFAEQSHGGRSVGALAPATKVAVIAVDTDNEFMNTKFGNNAANATSYIAELFVQMNVVYERDVNLRLLQGYTVLRPSTTTDPYSVVGSDCDPGPAVELCANSAQLQEFREYWNANYAPVKRALAVMLSGKQTSNNSASGIASLNVLCTTFGYSFNQVFKFAQQTASSDVGIVAHEIGHNMASPHTHCYANPKPDTCWQFETSSGNCFSGSPSCPTETVYNGVTARGTLMSYCHLLGGCSAANVFHPDSLSRYVNGAVSAATSCVFAIGAAAPTITSLSVTSGVLGGGTSTVITGTNFVSGATVAFVELPSNNVFGDSVNSKSAASLTFNSSTQITVTTPSATNTGAVDVVVMNPDYQTARLASGFTYLAAPPAPVVSAVVPNFGPVSGGTSVTITGSNFLSGSGVTFGGTAATSVVFVSSTTLTAVTPAHAAGLVDVVVTVPGPQGGTLGNGFFFAPAPSSTLWHPLEPCRVIDTRLANGPLGGPVLAANETRTFDVTTTPSTCGIPSTAKSLTVNYTVESAAQPGELRAFAANALWTGTSSISFKAGVTRANNGHLGLATDGTGTFKLTNASSGTVHFILDVNGYYE